MNYLIAANSWFTKKWQLLLIYANSWLLIYANSWFTKKNLIALMTAKRILWWLGRHWTPIAMLYSCAHQHLRYLGYYCLCWTRKQVISRTPPTKSVQPAIYIGVGSKLRTKALINSPSHYVGYTQSTLLEWSL